MRRILLIVFFVVLVVSLMPADSGERQPANFILSLDAGVPLSLLSGRYEANFGYSFLALAGQVRVFKSFFLEGSFAFYPQPRPGDLWLYNNDGFEAEVNGIVKFTPRRKLNPFLKIGLSYAWITYNNAWAEQYYPDAGRQRDFWGGFNAGAGIEYWLKQALLLRLGSVFTMVPNDGEGAQVVWGKFFAGIGIRL
jgi:hypothetical protein